MDIHLTEKDTAFYALAHARNRMTRKMDTTIYIVLDSGTGRGLLDTEYEAAHDAVMDAFEHELERIIELAIAFAEANND